MSAHRYRPYPTYRDDLMGWRSLVLDLETGETVRDNLTEGVAVKLASRMNGTDTPPYPYGCLNVRPGETEQCGQAPDGQPTVSGQPACPECRAAADAILDAHVAILVRRAAEIEAQGSKG